MEGGCGREDGLREAGCRSPATCHTIRSMGRAHGGRVQVSGATQRAWQGGSQGWAPLLLPSKQNQDAHMLGGQGHN
jgi:hypothetical protein